MPILEFMYDGKVHRLQVEDGLNEDQHGEVIDSYVNRLQRETRQPVEQQDIPVTPIEGDPQYQTPPKSWLDDFKQDIPRMVGGIAAPVAIGGKIAQVAQQSLPKAMGLSATAAGVGGAIGEAGQVGYESVTESPYAPKDTIEGAQRIAGAGLQEGIADFSGNLVLQGLSKLGKFSPFTPNIDAYTKELQTMLSRGGGVLSRRQLDPDSSFLTTVDNIASKAMFGKKYYKQNYETNEQALNILSQELSKDFFGIVPQLNDRQLGQLFVDIVNKGIVGHKKASDALYSDLDSAIAERMVQQNVTIQQPTGLVDQSGNPITIPVQQTIQQLVDNAPVDITGTKQKIIDEARKLSISNDVRERIVNTILNADDTLLFSSANGLRSELLSIIRSNDKTLQTSQAQGFAKYVEASLEQDMRSAASNAGILEKWEIANQFYKNGQEAFRNNTIRKLFKSGETNMARIGDELFKAGNVDEIRRAKVALRYASKQDPSIDYDTVWKTMQAGYFSDLLRSAKKEDAFSVAALDKILNDKKIRRTIDASFTKDTVQSLERFYDIVKRVSSKPEGSMGTAIQFAQAGAAADLAFLKLVDPVTASTILIAPAVLAKMLTNPDNIKLLNTGLTVPRTTKLGQATISKLIAEIGSLSYERNVTMQQQEQMQ